VLLYGFALLLTFLPTELGFLQRILGTTSLSGNQWLLCIVLAFVLLLVDEVVKVILRSRRGPAAAPAAAASAVAPSKA
jgi:Ca2+-transporting ATPase